MYRTVVIPLSWDGTPNPAVEHGVALARQSGATVTLLTIRPVYVDAYLVHEHLADVARAHGPDAQLEVVDADKGRESLTTRFVG